MATRKKQVKKKVRKKKVKVVVNTYRQVYPFNPMEAALNKLHEEGKISLTLDERRYFADSLVEEFCSQLELFSGLGAPIVRRVLNWVKGRQRDDVIR